jgi:SAM-dependent methyltransferase
MDSLPLFTNKTYASYEEAKNCICGKVNLVQSKESGFIYNLDFDSNLMHYDSTYNNEQGFSSIFLKHLHEVVDIVKGEIHSNSKVLEIGCGKGLFLNLLKDQGIDVIGFDPTYEGDDPNIIKDYFSDKYNHINADLVILRHTLEHIKDPFSFLHLLAKANNYKGKILIEVPTFDWISERSAFWDITYEHCNYFTEFSLGNMFKKSRTGDFFGGQYIYLVAELAQLKITITPGVIPEYDVDILKKLSYYKSFVDTNDSIALWGGATKGLLFLNQCDPLGEKIEYVIDINPAKQNRFIAKTGHKIYSPNILDNSSIKTIMVVNENYFQEVKNSVKNHFINVIQLE